MKNILRKGSKTWNLVLRNGCVAISPYCSPKNEDRRWMSLVAMDAIHFFLAAMGFEVEAADISDVAIGWLQQQVSKKNVPIQPVQMDFENELPAKEKYQVVLCFNYLERSLFPALKDALLQGGLLFFETVYRDDVTILASAMNPRYVLNYNELLHAFSDLRILEYREKIIYAADLGKKKALASMVARKN